MKNPQQDLAEIKSMMERSTRFLSLSGLSGILAGIYAISGAYLAYSWLYSPNVPWGLESSVQIDSPLLTKLTLTGIVVMILSITTAWAFSRKKSKKTASQLWTPAGKRFLQALFIPVITGGFFCMALLHQGYFHFIAPATLAFYGLGLWQASHFTLSEIRYLGYGQILLGIIAALFPQFGLLLWTLGFGALHIIYGSLMYYKYDR
ncbi:hypothetical protein [Cecembia calidifontis]|jgi:hypothetical protein|uniref:Uncharacterized protein n=1 Tax=Cecembia calidifontis TaxID=1187080 RepID=A0A4Q7P7G2_9BACT|nr:hypothetical protein [Cecembia calidifontis]RZS96076.1 hypothetical protein BC751_1632 [Cecembia calidifontis]